MNTNTRVPCVYCILMDQKAKSKFISLDFSIVHLYPVNIQLVHTHTCVHTPTHTYPPTLSLPGSSESSESNKILAAQYNQYHNDRNRQQTPHDTTRTGVAIRTGWAAATRGFLCCTKLHNFATLPMLRQHLFHCGSAVPLSCVLLNKLHCKTGHNTIKM